MPREARNLDSFRRRILGEMEAGHAVRPHGLETFAQIQMPRINFSDVGEKKGSDTTVIGDDLSEAAQ